jgi:hypothetical protein
MLDIIAQGEEIGLSKDMIYALEGFHEYALGEIAENIKESKGVSWEKAYSQAWLVITGKKHTKKGERRNPGVLDIPEGKKVTDLSLSHFETLAQKKGIGAVSRALNNLARWNTKKDPKLSQWAIGMLNRFVGWADKNQDKLSTNADLFDSYAPPLAPLAPQPVAPPTSPVPGPPPIEPVAPEQLGPEGSCLCTQCGHASPSDAGMTCAELTCPKCNIPLVRSEAPVSLPPGQMPPVT